MSSSALHTYRIECATQNDDSKRMVAFLISENREVTAQPAFRKLGKNSENLLRTRFDYWTSGKTYIQGYHGWNKSEFQGKYTNCFVFKCRENKIEHRFYGFLCNPKPAEFRYLVCVLIRYASKKKYETDETNLKIVESIGKLADVQKAITNYFV